MRRCWAAVVFAMAFGSCGDDPGVDVDDDGTNDDFYGDPANAETFFACRDGETDLNYDFGRYAVCLPPCSGGASCPPTPDGAAAVPRCEPVGTVDRCYLGCTSSAECPSGMVCVPDSDFCAFEREECTEDPSVCPDDMPCREAGTTGVSFCRYPR
jgi:hypothetical protein